MKFIEFLAETTKANLGHVVLHKIGDMVDNGHVDYSNKKISINIGKLIKDQSLYDLYLIVRKSDHNTVRLGKNHLDDTLAIVIDTDYFPQRQNVHKLFQREEIVKGFENAFHKYLDSHHNEVERENKTGHETAREVNKNKTFEQHYKDLEEKMKSTIQEYKAAKKDLEGRIGKSAIVAHQVTYKAALARLKKDTIGSSAKEFVSKMMKLASPKLTEHMDKEHKQKLVNRITNYYEHMFLDDVNES